MLVELAAANACFSVIKETINNGGERLIFSFGGLVPLNQIKKITQ